MRQNARPLSPLPPPIASADRARHVLVCGKTGSGKSVLLRALAARDMADGKGVLLLDPHGDLVVEVRGDVPRPRKNDVVLFDPTFAHCPGLNPLRHVPPEARPLVVAGILAVFRKLFGDAWGPRSEHVMRFALLAVAGARGATLAHVAAMLVDEAVRDWVLKQVDDEQVLAFWQREFPGYGKSFGAEVTAPILNKLGALLGSPIVRAVVKRSRPCVDADKALARSQVVLADVSKGKLGADASLVLGGFLLGAFQQAVMRRAAMPAENRVPFSILVDEFGSFASAPVLDLLAEARKYAVTVTVAVQSLSALAPDVRHALLGNVGTIVCFRVGAADAELLSGEFANEFGVKTLTSLDVGECVVRSGAKPAVLVPRFA